MSKIKILFFQPLFVMANKIDIIAKEDLEPEKAKIFEDLEKEGIPIFWTSTGIFDICL